MPEIQCDNCGKTFEKVTSQIAKTKNHFCCRKCFGEWNTQNKVGKNHPTYTRVKRECETCGKLFEVTPSELKKGWGRYCSQECHYNAGRTDCTCKQCGQAFTTPKNQVERITGGGSFCSKQCRREWQSIHTPKTPVYVMYGADNPRWLGGRNGWRGDNWRSQSAKARKRDGHKCKICGIDEKKTGRKLHVHHIKPFADFDGDWKQANRLSNLISLCPRCHQLAEHQLVPFQPPLL